MKTERPILFNADMVRALLGGRKTQTRRTVDTVVPNRFKYPKVTDGVVTFSENAPGDFPMWGGHRKCPYGKPGDLLWVQEDFLPPKQGSSIIYSADMLGDSEIDKSLYKMVVKYSVEAKCMKRELSRIKLRVTGVRVERLGAICKADAIAEGYAGVGEFLRGAWAQAHKDGNPWVWVIEFERVA